MTEVQVANLSLGRLGNFTISSLSETSAEAGHCNRFFEVTRQTLLRDFDFNFATAWEVLSQVADAELFDYDYCYALPSDYLRAISFDGINAGSKQASFKIANGRLYSDQADADNAKLEYIRDVTDVTEWDASFCTAFSYYLAAAIAPSIKASPELGLQLLQAGQAFLSDAKGADVQETGLRIRRGAEYSKYQRAREGAYGGPSWMLQDFNEPPN